MLKFFNFINQTFIDSALSLASSFVRANMHLGLFTTHKTSSVTSFCSLSLCLQCPDVLQYSTCITLAIDHDSAPCQSQAIAVSMDTGEYSHVLSRYSSSWGSLAGGWARGWGSSTS